MEVTAEQIEVLRTSFLEELSAKGQDAVHPKDVERFKRDDGWLRRFLLHHDLDHQQALAMVWESLTWRKKNQVNDLNTLAKTDILVQGGFYPHGRDIDGSALLVFKSKKYVKGSQDPTEMRRCVLYWIERLERQDNGKPITLFFDMEGCGLANMDMDFTKYLIGLFKEYYPFFLNYILIYEMPWVLSAAFKIIKAWLPEKAVQKIKFIGKKDIGDYVPALYILTCWGGDNNYSFSFIPESCGEENGDDSTTETPIMNNKKVHFADGSRMSESPTDNTKGDKHYDGGLLKVTPSNILSFNKENGGDLTGTVQLENIDSSIILSYKLKTTSPEKFRVRPSSGHLSPGVKERITVTLLPGFLLGGLSKDKFLIMSTPLEAGEVTLDLAELWKNRSGKKVNQHRLKCVQGSELINNGQAIHNHNNGMTYEPDHINFNQLSSNINKLTLCQAQLHRAVKTTQYYQFATLGLIVVLIAVVVYDLMSKWDRDSSSSGNYCTKP